MRNKFGLFLRKTRENRQKTVTAIATEVGLHKSVVSRIETGQVKILKEKLPLFAKAYGIPETELERLSANEDPFTDDNLIDLIRIVAEINPLHFTHRDFVLLVNVKSQLGDKELSAGLVRELLAVSQKPVSPAELAPS